MVGCLLCIIISYLYFPNNAAASPIIKIDSNQGQYELSPLIEILEDEHHELLVEDIHKGQYEDAFFHPKHKVPNFGYTSSSYWARITIENTIEKQDWYLQIAYPPLDIVRLYTPQQDGSFTLKETGDTLPFSSREIPHRNFIFRLDLPKDSTKTFYLHIITDGSMQLPITLSDTSHFQDGSIFEYLILGLYYGVGLIMVFYNLFLFFSLRLVSYIWYTLFIVCLIFVHFTLNGLSYQYIWPNSSWWNNLAILFFMGLSNITALLFSKSFLHAKIHTPWLDKVMNSLIGLQICFIFILLVNYELALNLMMTFMIPLVILVITTAVFSWRNGVKPAKYFFYGWIIFLIGVTISSLSDMGIIPTTSLTKYASQISSAIEIALFSLALGAKIKWLSLEKEAFEKQAMHSQQLAVKHLQQANQLKDEFLANTSHELRTPLQGIIGIAESLQEAKEMNSEWHYNLSLIISSGERLSHLINDLLDASKLKYHELAVEIEPVQLWKVAEVVCQVSAATYEKPVLLKNNIPEDLPFIAADETRLQQILYNLVSNAIKYTHKGEISIAAALEKDHIAIAVHDTGIGISKKDLNIIFDSFQRGSNIEDLTVTGTGLGLHITKQLVSLHGGEIFIESALNKGTKVTFTVPIYQEKETSVIHEWPLALSEKQTDKLTHPPVVNQVHKKYAGKILLVDDEPINVYVLYGHLDGANYEITIAHDGAEALALASKHNDFDLIILDVMLPKLSGLEVARKIRESYTFTELPILMLTAKSQIDNIVMAFDAGANDYLTKPCSKEELLTRVNTLLSLKQAMEELNAINMELHKMNQTLEQKVQKRTSELEYNTVQLEQMNTARKRLMTNISHELGTPMTVVKGYIKAMLDGVIDPHDQTYITRVYQKILFIERLIQDLYELARLESGQLSFTWKNIKIKAFINECIHPSRIDVTSQQIHFSFVNELSEQDEQDTIKADINRLKQVMQNLVYNAIRFTEKGGLISISAKITETPADISPKLTANQYLQITISDTGKGIHPNILEQIFERFFKEDKFNTGATMNTGLGLSISKEIIHIHNGTIWAESELGKGSSFHFLLPLMKKHEERVKSGEG